MVFSSLTANHISSGLRATNSAIKGTEGWKVKHLALNICAITFEIGLNATAKSIDTSQPVQFAQADSCRYIFAIGKFS